MSDTNAELDLFYIKVNNSDLPPDTIDDLIEAIVEDDLAQPAMFTLRFRDSEFTLIDGTLFKLGDEVQIAANDKQGQPKTILTGEVTALEPELTQERIELVVRGYDCAHRLYRGRVARTFLNQTVADVFQRVAQEAGLSAEVTTNSAVSQKFDYLVQDAQSDMEFLRDLAARTGYCMTVDGRTIKFTPESQRTASAPAQEFGEELLSFRARISVTAQANEVEVRGWDPSAKNAIVGNATSPSQQPAIDNGATGGDSAKKAFSKDAKIVICDQPVSNGEEARTLAQSMLDDLAGEYLSVEAECMGEPALKAGGTVELKGIGTRFSGTYNITSTRHAYIDGIYRTTIYVSGRNPTSILAPFHAPAARRLIHGVVVGLVTNVNDPDKIGRVKLKYPWFDEQMESSWVRVVVPGGGAQRGFMALPEVDDEMLVAFEHGDMNRPYVIGGLWNSKDKPPATAVNGEGKVELRTICTRAGHIVEFLEDGSAGKGAITIKSASGLLIKLSDNDKGVQITSAKHSITLDDQGPGTVKITSGGTLELSGAGSKLSFQQGSMELTGPGGAKLAFSPSGAELTAMGNKVALAPAGAEVSGAAKLDLKAGALVNVQGALVKIN